VALLFGVAFAMGYVVGQNSPRSAKMAGNAPAPVPITTADSRPQPAAPVVVQPPPTNPAQADPNLGQPSSPSGEGSVQPLTQPARDPSAPPPPASAAVVNATPEGPPGTYWQVMAVAQPEAEVMVRTLRDRGFPASMTQGPNNLVRVLVGPYSDTQTMGKAKTDLENAGFHPIRK
jgi:hypothetical protein